MMKWVFTLLFLILINLLYLDWKVFFVDTEQPNISSSTTTTEHVEAASTSQNNVCAPACLSAIKQATASAQTTRKTVQTQLVKEYFIPFGSGTSSNREWTDVGGLQAYINTANYPSIKEVTFEVSVYVPTGNETVNIRLYNATDNHPIWNSDVYFDGGTNAELLTAPITLDQGNKLYKVQMKTQLTYPAVIDQARVKIVTY